MDKFKRTLKQSKKFLSEHDNAKLVYFYNTAISAKHVSKLNDKSNSNRRETHE